MKRAIFPHSHENLLAWLALILLFLLGTIARGDTQDEVTALMQENFAACNEENLSRLLETMSPEMPNRNMFIIQCKREWAVSDLYYRLDDVKIVKQSKWRPPYVVATVTQTITGNDALDDRPGFHGEAAQKPDRKLSDITGLNPDLETSQQEVLFKKENGAIKMVACLTEPRAIGGQSKEASIKGDCSNGQCKMRWPRGSRD